MRLKITTLLFLMLISFLSVKAQDWNQIIKLDASDRATYNMFGYSVDIYGDCAIVGTSSSHTDENGQNSLAYAGAAYIFRNINGTWQQTQKLVASDRALGDYFGESVAIYGNFAIIGAHRESEDENGENRILGAGSSYLFYNNNGIWEQVQKIVASDRNGYDSFGKKVDIYGNYLIVSSYRDDDDENNANPIVNSGSAYIFQNINGNWQQVKKLVASDRELNDEFGYSVAISENYAVIGATNEDHDANGANFLLNSGSAYVYKNNNNSWDQVQKIVSSERFHEDYFSEDVSISGDYIMVGAIIRTNTTAIIGSGAVFVFHNNNGIWEQTQKLLSSDYEIGCNDTFGAHIDILDNYAIIGAQFENTDVNSENITGAGSAYIFYNNNGSWEQVQKLKAPEGAGGKFGYSVGLSDNNIITGAYLDEKDENGENAIRYCGSAYIITRLPIILNQPTDQTNMCENIAAYFSVTSPGATNFQWQLSTNGGVIFTDIPEGERYTGTQTANLTVIPNIVMNNYLYRCQISNSHGVVSSKTSILTVGGADITKPEITSIYNNIILQSDNGEIELTDYIEDVQAHDNCDTDLDVTQSPLPGTILSGEINPVTITVTDNSGNTSSVSFNVAAYVTRYWSEINKVNQFDRHEDDVFGESVAISGDYAIVGSSHQDYDASGTNVLGNAGAVYILKKVEGKWQQMQKLVSSDRASTDWFGYSVDIEGDYAIVGAYSDDIDASNLDAGAAYIFRNIGGVWQEVQKITPSTRSSYDVFGSSVSISGDYILVGSHGEDEDMNGLNNIFNAGAAYIFHNNAGIWQQVQKITASDRSNSASFGNSVSISGDYLVAGTLNVSTTGSAYIFHNNGSTWEQVQKIQASDMAVGDNFASAVAISDNHLIVGSSYDDEDALGLNTLSNAGSAYIFRNNGGNWDQIKKITPNHRAENDYFGKSVGISDNYAIVGANCESENSFDEDSLHSSGSAFIFYNNSDNWAQVEKITASDRSEKDQYGYSVAISDRVAIVGAIYNEINENGINDGIHAGAVYLYTPYPTIKSHPTDKIGSCSSDAVFEVEAINAKTYKWQLSSDGGINFIDISESNIYTGTQTSTLSVKRSGAMNDFRFRCIIANSFGTEISNSAKLTSIEVDNIKPTISSTHNDVVLYTDINCDTNLPDYSSYVIASDNCDQNLDITQSPAAGTSISGTSNTITLTVTDNAENFESVSFNLDVVDNTNPTVNCIQNQTKNINQGQTVYTVSGTELDLVSSSDNCGVASIKNDFNNQATLDGVQFPVGITNVSWTVTDLTGNSATCNFTVVVNVTTGISDLAKSGISIHPNPTNGILKIECKQNNIKSIAIKDLSGKVIIYKTKIMPNEIIDISSLNNGIYVISIQTDNVVFTAKIIKE